ncbi:glycogen/starch/alpha-glucan phosphorylase [Vulcanisaeta souniana]|uniref:Glycosyl transferase family 1 n=1 Tax=Vulcanisaeta souniana JCM 11219 TaxID=1293586 RepID=A0A830E7U0_9CREN|nr:glycogen/starch/alpha-glucan phosphorylase [Vulcanisaeta souniana]BDR91010.1 glycosyl transferase family 1 [Vulcanisaeta souniana JCM 11219]GGI79977.1 glycosyl transferase family 1 [Vulcanisaeta souniana JCM 11219]
MTSDVAVIISITPDLALDMGYTYAGGLGVLEGDKFYGAAALGLNYYVITLLYRSGYVDYDFNEGDDPIPKPQPQPKSFLDSLRLVDTFTVKLRGEEVEVNAWEYRLGSAHAVFLEPRSPSWALRLVDRVYIESGIEEKFLKYIFLAKGAVEFIRRNVGLENVKYIDLQEAYAAMVPITLKIPGRYRLIIHTPGPWGHPSFPNKLFEEETGYRFIEDPVVLTSIGAAMAWEVIMVSSKHYDIMKKVIPQFISKARFITNGVDLNRWMDPEIRMLYEKGLLTREGLGLIKARLRNELQGLIRSYKSIDLSNNAFITAWVRRMTLYKRPHFVTRLIEEGEFNDVIFILGGKSHPMDKDGLIYMKKFRELHRKYKNVVYIHDYDVNKAKTILKGIDVLLFTPFPGWEASGTSFMKAAINGVPSISSRDGAAVELITDGVNGWLFGSDVRDLVDFANDPRGKEIDEKEYDEFKARFSQVYDMYNTDKERFYLVSLSAILSFVPRVDIKRVLREYYPDLVH